MNKILLPAIACFAFAASAFAQSNIIRCSSHEYMQHQLATVPGLQQVVDQEEQATAQFVQAHPNGYQSRAIVTIPVIFHVVYNTNAQNIPDSRLLAQIGVLNKDYRKLNSDANLIPAVWQSVAADCEIEFCLAKQDPSGNWTNGIERISSGTGSWTDDDAVKFASSGGANAWDRNRYLNIWICNLGGGLLGYSAFPGGPASTDGVVLNYMYVGTTGATAPYNKGRTATHEIGHWFNLYHIWGDDGTSCSGSDNCADTPNQADEHYNCPGGIDISCNNGPNGDMWMNYMDYTDDACMYMFTQGQKTRMWAALNGSRSSIQSSNACMVTGIAQVTLDNAFSLYPTPTRGAFTLTFANGNPKNFDVSIYNVLGETVYAHHYDALDEAELHLDLEGNAPGIYMVEVHTATARITKKIVLEN